MDGLLSSGGQSILCQSQCKSLQGKRIGIIGGGLGGLSAAFEASQLNAEVVVFEARKIRAGGRARTYPTFGHGTWVEAGPEFIGEQHQEWRHYADLFGLELVRAEDYSGPFSPVIPYPADRDFTEDAAAQLTKATELVVPELNELAKDIDPYQPWNSKDAEELDRESVYDVLVDAADFKLRSGLLLDAWCVQVEANQGVHPREISLLGYLSQIAGHGVEKFWNDTESYRCLGGVENLVAKFVEALGSRIRFGAEVVRIEWNSRGAKVILKDGTVARFDHLAIAVPVALVKKIEFEPALPAEYLLTWGRNTKFFAPVRKDFPVKWGLNPLAIKELGRLQLLWEATAGQHRDIKVVTGFSGGKDARELSNMDPADRRNEACLDELELLMPGFRQALVGPVHFKNWPNSEFTGSGYSYPRPGDVTTKWKAISAGLGPIGFVGEGYSPRYWAFMNGALESAVRFVRTVATQG